MSVVTVADTGPRVLGLEWFPLNRSAICLECEAIYRLGSTPCPACGGTACMALERWLKSVRETQREGGYQPRPLPHGLVPLAPPRKP